MKAIRQYAAIALTSGVAVASLSAPAAAVHPAPAASTPAARAASYLAGKLTGKHHDHLVDIFKHKAYADDGETADAILSLDAAGVAQSAAARATKWLEKDAANYAGKVPDVYPGSAGKLLLVAEAQHINPKKFGSLNLIQAITKDEGAGGASAGQYQNPSDTSYSSSITNQSLAIVALANTGKSSSQPDAAAVKFLSGQQCSDGGFQNSIRTDTTAPCSGEDVDTTSYAIQALVAVKSDDAAKNALSWLKKARNSDAGYPSNPGDDSDANSTALAAQALVASGTSTRGAATWLAKHQLGCSSKTSQRGAVTYQGSYDTASAERATSQAGVALAGDSLTTVDNKGAAAAVPAIVCQTAN